ncbi:AI-2E family transporter [Novipirellula caenicola]|uniref:Inner membrane protein n=1 Tax=Novipirellula caenicola TaxID=1536901 RepID=A0ABP9VL23_9BACT
MTKRRPKNSAKPPQPSSSLASSPQSSSTTGTGVDPSPPRTLASTKAMLERLPSLSRILSVLMLLLGIFAVGALFYKVMAGFFVPLFLAALLVVIFRPVHDWIYIQTKGKRRLAAATTTLMILMMVLMPIIVVLSVATSQFTAMVSHINFNDLTNALDRARDQFGISLPHAEKFRRLDELTDSLDDSVLASEGLRGIDQETSVAEFLMSLSGVMQASEHRQIILDNISEAKSLILFLQNDVEGPPAADAAAEIAIERLDELKNSLPHASEVANRPDPADPIDAGDREPAADSDVAFGDPVNERNPDDVIPLDQLNAEEQFHRQSVIASAAIRSWMQTLLGGTLRSQVRLIANPSAEDFKSLMSRGRESLQPRFVSLTSATGNYLGKIVVGLLVLIIAVYFFLIDGAAMIRTLMRLSPLDDNYERRLLLEFDRTSRAVVLASVLSAIVQGILGGLGYYVLGFESVVLLFLATTLMSLVPFLGAASVWVPCVVWLGMVEQRWTAAIVLALYGMLVISSIDNVIKVYVLHGRSQLHPLFALLSVLGGVKVFGPIGILVGPMVVVFLQTLLEILNHELDDTASAEAITETTANEG